MPSTAVRFLQRCLKFSENLDLHALYDNFTAAPMYANSTPSNPFPSSVRLKWKGCRVLSAGHGEGAY